MATSPLLWYIHLCQCQWPCGLRRGYAAADFWDCGFESRRGYRCLSLLNCVLSVEASASGRSLIQSSPTECGVCI